MSLVCNDKYSMQSTENVASERKTLREKSEIISLFEMGVIRDAACQDLSIGKAIGTDVKKLSVDNFPPRAVRPLSSKNIPKQDTQCCSPLCTSNCFGCRAYFSSWFIIKLFVDLTYCTSSPNRVRYVALHCTV